MVLLLLPKHNLRVSNFTKRIFSSAIGGPVAVGTVMLGSPYVDILAFILLAILLWEWSKMSGLPLSHPIHGVVGIGFIGVILGGGFLLPSVCLALVGFLYVGFYHYRVRALLLPSLILLAGPLYIGFGMAALLYLAKFAPLTVLWALLIVWATDIGAYGVGSLVGGPKLVPRMSPNKTWSGLIGGSILGSALGMTMAPICQIDTQNEIFLLGLTIMATLVGHTGDILESAAKRLFKVKDSSHIIPGHGGMLDRMDSLLLVALFFYALKFFKMV